MFIGRWFPGSRVSLVLNIGDISDNFITVGNFVLRIVWFTKFMVGRDSSSAAVFTSDAGILSIHVSKRSPCGWTFYRLVNKSLELGCWCRNKFNGYWKYNRLSCDTLWCLMVLGFSQHFSLWLNACLAPSPLDWPVASSMRCKSYLVMMTSSNKNIFRVTGFLCGKFTGHRWIPHTKAGDAELWCFLFSASE